MKSCLRNKSIFLTLFLAVLVLITCFVFAGCSFGNSSKLTDATSNAVVEGGGFEEGSTLSVTMLQDTEATEYCEAINAIASQSYDTTKPVYIFDISVTNDGVKVQPNGKVKVTIPVSKDLTGYDVLHIKDDGKVERLTVTYRNGKATFETTSFSKFVFVKKISPSDSGSEGGSGTGGSSGDTTTTYVFTAEAKNFTGTGSSGGAVWDENENSIWQKQLNAGSEYTVRAHCYPNYYFLGWYSESDDTLISTDNVHTFTINSDINIYAMFAYKTDVLELKLDAYSANFSYKNGKPTTTLVAKGSSVGLPNSEMVTVYGLQANGEEVNYYYLDQYPATFNDNLTLDEGGLDTNTVGTYNITYTLKQNENVKATLVVQVVEGGNSLKVSTAVYSDNLGFRYNVGEKLYDLNREFPADSLITLTAEVTNGYIFTGWYDANDNLVSNKLVYCFKMPNNEVQLFGKCEKADNTAVDLTFSISYSEGELVDDFGNECVYWSGSITEKFAKGTEVSFTARECRGYNFRGWYKMNNSGDFNILLTEDKTLTLTLNESMSIKAAFIENLQYIELNSDTLLQNGFVNGKLAVAVDDTAVDFSSFEVFAKGVKGSYTTLSPNEYTITGIDSIDYTTAGTYTITYTYKYDTKFKTSLQIVVVDPSTPTITFEQGASYLDHEYNGKATFISLRDVKLNGTPLYEFKADSEIWEKISYKWIDTTTNQEVDTTDADITINGTVNKKFGPSSDPFTVGNEFCGPIQAGSYRFEFYYDGEKQFTQNSTISTHTYTKITTKNEFQTAEGSTLVNFELYYHTIVGVVDGEYYVMQMPSIRNSDENVSVEARKVTPNADGSISLGGGNDFAFVNMKYYANDPAGYTEFLTGYYGSYVIRSSNNTADGTIWGTPYIYRTGYTSFSDGKIYRDYGDKSFYGNQTIFDENGAVTIYSRQSSSNNKLRLVKDGDKYVFTTVAQEGDDRQSYDIFVYRSVLDTNNVQDDSKK